MRRIYWISAVYLLVLLGRPMLAEDAIQLSELDNRQITDLLEKDAIDLRNGALDMRALWREKQEAGSYEIDGAPKGVDFRRPIRMVMSDTKFFADSWHAGERVISAFDGQELRTYDPKRRKLSISCRPPYPPSPIHKLVRILAHTPFGGSIVHEIGEYAPYLNDWELIGVEDVPDLGQVVVIRSEHNRHYFGLRYGRLVSLGNDSKVVSEVSVPHKAKFTKNTSQTRIRYKQYDFGVFPEFYSQLLLKQLLDKERQPIDEPSVIRSTQVKFTEVNFLSEFPMGLLDLKVPPDTKIDNNCEETAEVLTAAKAAGNYIEPTAWWQQWLWWSIGIVGLLLLAGGGYVFVKRKS